MLVPLFSTGVGFTVTLLLKVCGFVQLLAVTWYTYTTVCCAVVLFVRVSLILPVPVAPAPAFTPVTPALVQLKVAPVVVLCTLYVKAWLLHWLTALRSLLTTAAGFTVTTTFWVLPQPLALRLYT